MLMTERVEKRGNKWCVVHGTGSDAGQIIHCYEFGGSTGDSEDSAKQKAHKRHYAIMKSKEKRSGTSPVSEAVNAIHAGIPTREVVTKLLGNNLWH